MALLQSLNDQPGFLKAGFLGFNKSGKTWTAILLALGVRKLFGLTGPIAFFDTEGGSQYVADMVKKETEMDLVGIKSRSLDDLSATVDECVASGVSVLVAESMTHVWRELCESYLRDVNEQRKRTMGSKFYPRKTLEFQDWGPLKRLWAERWADRYLNAPLHIIIAGRAGYEYDMEENEETHKKELTKTGIKMKTEGEFGFEPSLLVEMQREQEPDKDAPGGFRIVRRATVIGDRFGVIDGATTTNPTFEFFLPHVGRLRPGAHTLIDMSLKTQTGADEDGDTDWHRERKTRAILCEEIQGDLVNAYPGQTATEKKSKTDLIHMAFNTRSWTAVESMPSERLREGLAQIRAELRKSAEVASTVASTSKDAA